MGLAKSNTTSSALIATAAAVSLTVAGIYYFHFKKIKMSCPFSGASSGDGKCPYANAAKSYPGAAKATDSGVVTGLTDKRTSDGMGLPDAMSQATIDMIVATAPAVAPKMLDITKCFYAKVLGKHPELKQFFNPAVRRVQTCRLSCSCRTRMNVLTMLSFLTFFYVLTFLFPY
jgi:hypothetical protein